MIGNLQRLVEDPCEIAAVIGDAGGRRERQLRRLDEVALAQRQPIDAHLVSGTVDQPLHVVVGFGAAGAAIGAHQRGVGQNRLDVDAEQRRAVDTRKVLAGVERQRPRCHAGDVGAEIAVALQTHRQKPAFGIERQFGVNELRAAVAVGEEAGRALVGPLHGAAQRLRRVQDAGVFGIADVLHAEGAADISAQDANLVVRHVEDFRQRHLVAGDALRRYLQREAFGRLVEGSERHARLHRHHGDTGVDDVEFGYMRRSGKRRVDLGRIAIVIIERDVIRDVIIELRRAGLCGLCGIGYGGQRLDVEFDGLRRIACLRQRFRDHKGDGVADKAHLVGHQRRTVGLQ